MTVERPPTPTEDPLLAWRRACWPTARYANLVAPTRKRTRRPSQACYPPTEVPGFKHSLADDKSMRNKMRKEVVLREDRGDPRQDEDVGLAKRIDCHCLAVARA